MILPKQGTPEYAAFMSRAKNPASVEAKVIAQIVSEQVTDVENQTRQMLQLMIEKVEGQLFRDVSRFHEKFGLEPVGSPDHRLPEDLMVFRLKFMMEELQEYADAVGGRFKLSRSGNPEAVAEHVSPNYDPEKAFDALIDLVYVALGTAYLHRFPFNRGWDRVQEANMSKVRADGASDARSHRGHAADVVKPPGWVAPILSDLLDGSEPWPH